jgi:xanthine dehydrogenase accessory factor
MDPLFRTMTQLLREGKPFAVGTVVHTAGSTPQKTGARALFLPGGEILGTLGGGCMEAEARRRGLQLVSGGTPELMELQLDDDFGWDDGLICGGSANILLQPRPAAAAETLEAVLSLHEARERGVFVLVASGETEALGRCCLVRPGAETVGDPGSPELRAAIEQAARQFLDEGREEPRRLRLRDPEVILYLEPILPLPVCFIAGAGHIGGALCHYAARVGFEVVVVDDRPSLCNPENLPDAAHTIAADIVETVRSWPKTADTYFVIVTRGHRHDAVVLREVIHAPLAYVGMIGSKRKILTIYEEFLAEGLATAEELARVRAPIGLEIGAISVEEIALCIAAELIMVRRTRAGGAGSNGVAAVQRDCPGGGRVPEDGDAQAALAVRQRDRHSGGRPLAESLPARGGAGGSGSSR